MKCEFWISTVQFLGHVIESQGIHMGPAENPLTKQTQKNVKYDWGDKEEEAFQLLKEELCSAPVLGSHNDITQVNNKDRNEMRR